MRIYNKREFNVPYWLLRRLSFQKAQFIEALKHVFNFKRRMKWEPVVSSVLFISLSSNYLLWCSDHILHMYILSPLWLPILSPVSQTFLSPQKCHPVLPLYRVLPHTQACSYSHLTLANSLDLLQVPSSLSLVWPQCSSSSSLVWGSPCRQSY